MDSADPLRGLGGPTGVLVNNLHQKMHKRTHSNGGVPPIRVVSATTQTRRKTPSPLILLVLFGIFSWFFTRKSRSTVETAVSNLDLVPDSLVGFDEAFPSHLEFLLKRRSSPKYGKFMTVIYVNDGDRDMVLNWLCHARAIGYKNYIFVTTDEYLLWWLRYKAAEGAVYLQMPDGEMQTSEQRKAVVRPPRFVYNDKNFKNFMLDRTKFVLNLLNRGWDVLIADVDQVWLDDPRDSLFDPARKEGYDIVAQDDVTMLCGGFMLLRSNGTFAN